MQLIKNIKADNFFVRSTCTNRENLKKSNTPYFEDDRVTYLVGIRKNGFTFRGDPITDTKNNVPFFGSYYYALKPKIKRKCKQNIQIT